MKFSFLRKGTRKNGGNAILLRGKESGRADDASEEVIRDRIKVYHEQTAIVADFYAKQDVYKRQM